MKNIIKSSSNVLNVKDNKVLTPSKIYIKNIIAGISALSINSIATFLISGVAPLNIGGIVCIFSILTLIGMCSTLCNGIFYTENLVASNNMDYLFAPFHYLAYGHCSNHLSSIGAYFGSNTLFLEGTVVDYSLTIKNLKYLRKAIANNKKLSDKYAKLFLLLSTNKFESQTDKNKTTMFLEVFKDLLSESLDDISTWNENHSKRKQIIINIELKKLLEITNSSVIESYQGIDEDYNSLYEKVNNCNRHFISVKKYLRFIEQNKIQFDSNFKINFLKNNLHLFLNDTEIIKNLNKFFDNIEDYCFLANLDATEVETEDSEEEEIIPEVYNVELFLNDFKELK